MSKVERGAKVAKAAPVKSAVEMLEEKLAYYRGLGLGDGDIAVLLKQEARKLDKQERHRALQQTMTRERFANTAEVYEVVIPALNWRGTLRINASKVDKSYGWNISEKVRVTVDGEELECQLGMNISVIGSKPVVS